MHPPRYGFAPPPPLTRELGGVLEHGCCCTAEEPIPGSAGLPRLYPRRQPRLRSAKFIWASTFAHRGDFDPQGGTSFLLVAARRHHLQIPYQLCCSASDSHCAPGRKEADIWTDISRPDQWALLWSFKYTWFKQLPQLAPHHRVNYFENGGLVRRAPCGKRTRRPARDWALWVSSCPITTFALRPPAFIRRWDADKTAGDQQR